MSSHDIPGPYLLFVGGAVDAPFAKTALGLTQWAPERCLAEWGLADSAPLTGLPRLAPAQAAAAGARSLVISVAAMGGGLAPAWIPALFEALEAGLDLVSGMHQRLDATPQLAEAAARLGRRLIDVRRPPQGLPVGNGRKRTGKRLLTVGTDCALGKKYTALSLAKAFKARGLDADFRATGQTGILIAGSGIPIDAVVADFVAGAAETLSPDAAPGHWDVIEGQGSLFQPAYAGVSLGLLHGSQPDVIVLCHELGRAVVAGLPHYALPDLEEALDLTLRLARRTNPAVRCAGISLSPGRAGPDEADAAMDAIAARLGLPCADPLRDGPRFQALVASCLS